MDIFQILNFGLYYVLGVDLWLCFVGLCLSNTQTLVGYHFRVIVVIVIVPLCVSMLHLLIIIITIKLFAILLLSIANMLCGIVPFPNINIYSVVIVIVSLLFFGTNKPLLLPVLLAKIL